MREGAEGNAPCARLCVVGAFALTSATGRDLTPRGQKAKALLALLATTERGVRARAWLCDKLWSDRDTEQAQANLRQTLTQIRRQLEDCAGIVDADRLDVRLRLDLVKIDLVELRKSRSSAANGETIPAAYLEAELLEGLDVRDPEFEDWLAVERSHWSDLRESLLRKASTPIRLPALPASAAPQAAPPASLLPLSLGIAQPWHPPGDEDAAHLGEIATDLLIRSILEIRQIDVIDQRDRAGHGGSLAQAGDSLSARPRYSLRTRVITDHGRYNVEVTIADTQGGKIEWFSTTATNAVGRYAEDIGLLRAVNNASEVLYALFARADGELRNRPDLQARQLLLSAVDDLFDIGKERLFRAEARIRQSLALAPSSQASAWLAFASTFKVGQKHAELARADVEEVEYLVRRALELDPANSLSLTLCGHVVSYLFRNPEDAAELFVKALALNPNRALTWDLFSVLHSYSGRPDLGLKCAEWARHIGLHSPYGYYFDASCCISASLAGRHDEAVAHGRRALAGRPNFNPVLRFLVSSLGHLKRPGEAQIHLARLRTLEPAFSIGSVLQGDHAPMQARHRDDFLAGLRGAGVPSVTV